MTLSTSQARDFGGGDYDYEAAFARIDELAADSKRRIEGTMLTVEGLGVRVGDTMSNAFGSWIDSAVDGTFKLRDALSGLLKDLAKIALRMALLTGIQAIAPGFGGFLGIPKANAMGNAFPGGMSLDPGIYTKPTLFKFAKGGVLGEAGPEAVLPLARMPSRGSRRAGWCGERDREHHRGSPRGRAT